MNTYSNIMLDYFLSQLFIKVIFSHANKLKDTFPWFNNIFHVCFIIFVCMDLLLSYLKRNCRYYDASLLFQHASPKYKYILLYNHIITAKMFPVVPKIAVFFQTKITQSCIIFGYYYFSVSFNLSVSFNPVATHPSISLLTTFFFFLSEKFSLVVL